MRQSVPLVALLTAFAIVGCNPTPKPEPPAPPPAAPAVPPPAPAPSGEPVKEEDPYDRIHKTPIDEINRMGLFAEVHFDYDKADIREGDKSILQKNADLLKKYDFLIVTVEGHCDERGSVEYNLALGDRRAKASYDYLVSLGVPAARLKTVSYGKEIPVCHESNADCWARNRRDVFNVTGKVK
jgi:peptidoglycan-associated lipoprotein